MNASATTSDFESAVSEALTKATAVETQIGLRSAVGGATMKIAFRVTGAMPGSSILVAAVERGLMRMVTAGENEDKTLYHENVVRALVEIPLRRCFWPRKTRPGLKCPKHGARTMRGSGLTRQRRARFLRVHFVEVKRDLAVEPCSQCL